MARYVGAVDRCKVGGRVAQALDPGITDTVGAPLLRVFCGGRESEMPAAT